MGKVLAGVGVGGSSKEERKTGIGKERKESWVRP